MSAVIGGIPSGSNHNITPTTVSTDGNVSCAGSASFNVSPRATSAVSMHLTCHEAPRTGSVLVNGNVNVCPVIDSTGASPVSTIVGTAIRLSSAAHDADGGPSPITYAWTATSGVVGRDR